MDRDKHHKKKSVIYQGVGRGDKGTHSQGTGLYHPEGALKHDPLLGDLVHLPTHKWVDVLGLRQECKRDSGPRESCQEDPGLSQGLAVRRLAFRFRITPPIALGAQCADTAVRWGTERQPLETAG